MDAPIFITPRWDLDFHVQTNVSNLVIKAMLTQNPTGKCNQSIAYAYRLLNNAKCNYTTMECEPLAMAYALHKFWHYLLSNKFVFYMDHMALLYLIKKLVFGCIARLFMEYDFLVVYKPSKSHLIVDILLRFLDSTKKRSTWPNFKCYPFHITTYLVVKCPWLLVNQDLYGSFLTGVEKEISFQSFSFHIISWCSLSTRSWSCSKALLRIGRNFDNRSGDAWQCGWWPFPSRHYQPKILNAKY